MIGDSGTGKSHLLIALGTAAAQAGHKVRYVLAAKLVNELVEAADERQLSRTIARYGRVELLCLDELGYMELDKRGAELLFQVLTEREEKTAVAIASNDSFGWLDQDLHRPPALRRHRRPPDLRREHHRDRHPQLPPRARPQPASPEQVTFKSCPNSERRRHPAMSRADRPRTSPTQTSSDPKRSPMTSSMRVTTHTAASLTELLDTCEEFLRTASPVVHAELRSYLDRQRPPADPSWLIDMLGFSSAHLRHLLPAVTEEPSQSWQDSATT